MVLVTMLADNLIIRYGDLIQLIIDWSQTNLFEADLHHFCMVNIICDLVAGKQKALERWVRKALYYTMLRLLVIIV